MARRTARGDIRVDGALVAVSLLIAVIAIALPDARATNVAGLLRSSVVAPLVRLNQRAEMVRRALAVHDSTAAVADSIVRRAQDADVLAAENARLRDVLRFGARSRWLLVPAEAILPPADGEPFTVLLSRGARDGVRDFAAVVAPEGVVGTVRAVSATTSVALLWSHPDFRVSAMSADGDAAGIIAPHLGTEGGRFLLEFRGVPFRSSLDSGTVIVSSGAGGVFPRGIPIGTILREIETAEGWSRTYLVRPAVRPADVGSVMVLRADSTQFDARLIWTPPVVDTLGALFVTDTAKVAVPPDSLVGVGR